MRRDEPYERPLVEPDNPLTGGFQTGHFDASPGIETGRSAARWALAFALLWIFGVGSLVALGCAGLALASGEIGPRHRRMALAAIGLGLVGLAASAVVAISA